MDLGRRDFLKIGGGVLGFTGGASGFITLMQRPAAAVEAQVQFTGPEDDVNTAGGELSNFSLSLAEYTIQYQNLTIIDRDSASLEFGILVDVFSGSEIVLAGSLFEDVQIPIESPSDFHNLLNRDEVNNEYQLLDTLSKSENTTNDRTFTVPDGESETVEVSIRPYIRANGLSEDSTEEIEAEGEEIGQTVRFDIVNEGTSSNVTVDGTLDAS